MRLDLLPLASPGMPTDSAAHAGNSATDKTPHFSESRRTLIAEAAYGYAERRGFAPGHELEDWLAAEAAVV